MIKKRVEMLEQDIKDKLGMSFKNTGNEIMEAYGYHKDALHAEAFELAYFYYDGKRIDLECTPDFITLFKDEYFADNCSYSEEDNSYMYSVRKKDGLIELKDFIDYIISLKSNELVSIFFLYYGISICKIFVNKSGIKSVIFDPCEEHITTIDGNYISDEFNDLIWIHSLLSLSLNKPLNITFKILGLI